MKFLYTFLYLPNPIPLPYIAHNWEVGKCKRCRRKLDRAPAAYTQPFCITPLPPFQYCRPNPAALYFSGDEGISRKISLIVFPAESCSSLLLLGGSRCWKQQQLCFFVCLFGRLFVYLFVCLFQYFQQSPAAVYFSWEAAGGGNSSSSGKHLLY